MAKFGISRRALLGAGLILPVAACSQMSDSFYRVFGSPRSNTLLSRGDRMARWIRNEGRDAMMAPEGLTPMGISNQGRDIPAKLIGVDGKDGRYVIVLITIRGKTEFILHRKQDDTLMMHNCDLSFNRLSTVRYPHYGKPTIVTDQLLAENDFQQQLTFWFDRMPGR